MSAVERADDSLDGVIKAIIACVSSDSLINPSWDLPKLTWNRASEKRDPSAILHETEAESLLHEEISKNVQDKQNKGGIILRLHSMNLNSRTTQQQ